MAADLVVFMNGPLAVGLSGGDLHALRLCDALAARGGTVRLVAPPSMRPNLPAAVGPALVEVTTPLDRRLSSMPAYLIAVTLRMLRSLRLGGPARWSVASSHFFFDTIPAALRRGGTAAYVYHLVGESDRAPGLRSLVSEVLERVSLLVLRRSADVVFVDNPETRDALLARGFAATRLHMTRNAYDPLVALPPHRPASPPLAVFVGRLVEVKGVWDVVALAERLRDEAPGVRIAMLGDGPLRPELEARLRERGLGDVELLGFVEEEEKWRRLGEASLFVFPSREEGWGIAVGEALLAGVPALVYDLPAYAHFGDLPRTVPLGDERGFVDAAVALLRDEAALAEEAGRVAALSHTLPRWREILDEELAVMLDRA